MKQDNISWVRTHIILPLAYYLLPIILLASCDKMEDVESVLKMPQDKNAVATSHKFSSDYQCMTIKINVAQNIGSTIRLDDARNVDIMVHDDYRSNTVVMKPRDSKLKSIKYVAPEYLSRGNFDCLVLIDLCQPTAIIQKQHDYVKNIHSAFSHENLYLAFMLPGGKVTNIVAATDYVIDNYINANAPMLDNNAENYALSPADDMTTPVRHAYLYRSVANILGKVLGHTGTTFDSSTHKIFLVFSDGLVYNDDDMPIDPMHFQMQENLVSMSSRLQGNVKMYYASLTQNPDVSLTDNKMMQLLCQSSGGRYLSGFSWNAFQDYISQDFRYPITDYEVVIEYKKGSIFWGNGRFVNLEFFKKGTDELIADCNCTYDAGSIKVPLVVGEVTPIRIYLAGFTAIILMFGIIWIVMQLIIPFVRYRIFKNKYLHKYTGPNMSAGGTLVADTCYYCKAPFRIGDDIVTKCQHTMHLDCWEENGQHCPEHGTHCPEGSHYYNHSFILDPHNATFYMKWVMFAFIAILLGWGVAIWFRHNFLYDFLEDTISIILPEDSMSAFVTSHNQFASSSMYFMIEIAMEISLLMTLAFSFAASYHRIWYKRLLGVLMRGFSVVAITFIIFYTEFCAEIAFGRNDNVLPADTITWTLMTYAVIFVSTYRSRIKINIRNMIIFGFAAGLFASIVWTICGMESSTIQVFWTCVLLLLYAASLSVIIARPLPVNDHSFLHVTGEIKEMDIALYKWLRQSENAIVTIGRSIDCSLQLTWDTKSDLAPVHAKIRQNHGAIFLTAVDGDVITDDKTIPEGKWVQLYHGDTFTIGTTTFTYIET